MPGYGLSYLVGGYQDLGSGYGDTSTWCLRFRLPWSEDIYYLKVKYEGRILCSNALIYFLAADLSSVPPQPYSTEYQPYVSARFPSFCMKEIHCPYAFLVENASSLTTYLLIMNEL